ncbi:DUF5684 domain-containing protein [Humibacillus xanthopallidus]|uniref:Signal peptidase I n=1 Tax=Humibacillus xanthopallidus TaxID=412689 RepID=A0A543HIN8_9MICO|nr:DUF5684 domain-containing protein [Humibacillus xanthopallidus]TQM58203.1 hypothetical protein FBY41_3563 [Humibacillus xanthopallidus]
MASLSTVATLVADTTTTSAQTGPALVGGLLGYVIGAIALMGVFRKAGEPAWAAWVPFYNAYVLTRIAGYNPWMFLLFLIPIVNFIFSIMVALGLGRAFGKGGAFSFFLLWMFAIIGYFVVGYGSAQFVGRGGARAGNDGRREALV